MCSSRSSSIAAPTATSGAAPSADNATASNSALHVQLRCQFALTPLSAAAAAAEADATVECVAAGRSRAGCGLQPRTHVRMSAVPMLLGILLVTASAARCSAAAGKPTFADSTPVYTSSHEAQPLCTCSPCTGQAAFMLGQSREATV